MSNISSRGSQPPWPEETRLFGVALDLTALGTPLRFLCCMIIVLGLMGNIAVIIITWANKAMRSTTNYLVTNLAIADSLVLLSHLPLPIVRSSAWCKGVHYLLYTGCNASIGALVALALDRYLAIVHYTTSRPFRTVKRINIGATIMWLLICIYSLPELWMFGVRQHGNTRICLFLTQEGWDSTILSVFVVLIGYIIPLTCITTLYFLIFKYISSTELDLPTAMNVSNRRKKKAIPMLIATVVAYAVCYAPTATGYILYVAGINPFRSIEFVIIYSTLITLNSSLNPVIYALFSESYRKAFKGLFADIFY